MARLDWFYKWWFTGDTRMNACIEYRWQNPDADLTPHRITLTEYREGLRLLMAKKGAVDDRPWNDTAYRGEGNRAKRRAGWVLFRGSCSHDPQYDCCCEPRSYYVDPKELQNDLREGRVSVVEWQEGGRTVRHGSFCR